MNIADKGDRFGNYLVDCICFSFILMTGAFAFDGWLGVVPEDGSPLLGILFFILYFLYHFLFELLGGKTPGKYLTRTRVVNSLGEKPGLRQLVIRNLCRLILFDNLSFLFGKGLHDGLSGTIVIKENKNNAGQ